MAISKTIDRYPEQFITLAERIESAGEFSVKNVPRKVAENLRFQFYGFRKAATNSGLTRDRFQKLAGVSVLFEQVSAASYNVNFVTAENTEVGSLLDNALNAKAKAKPISRPEFDLTQNAQTEKLGFPSSDSLPQTQDSLLNDFLSGDE
jgi:hypothetical protein